MKVTKSAQRRNRRPAPRGHLTPRLPRIIQFIINLSLSVVVVSWSLPGAGPIPMSARQGKCCAKNCATFPPSPPRDAHPRARSSSEGCKRICLQISKAGPTGNRLGHKITADLFSGVFAFIIKGWKIYSSSNRFSSFLQIRFQ